MFALIGTSQDKNADAVKSIDGIVNEILHLISVEKGEKVDTASLRNLFTPNAILTVLDQRETPVAETIPVDDFIVLLTDSYYEKGFYETELHQVVDEFNGIAQVFQTFYAKDGDGHEGRGITSFQLAYYDNRWWIVSVLWTDESERVKLPEKYLSKD